MDFFIGKFLHQNIVLTDAQFPVSFDSSAASPIRLSCTTFLALPCCTFWLETASKNELTASRTPG